MKRNAEYNLCHKESIDEWQKYYYQQNKEIINEKHKQYYQKEKEIFLERLKKYKKTPKGKLVHYKSHRRYFLKNRDKINKWRRKYCNENREKIHKRCREYYKQHRDIMRLKYREYYHTTKGKEVCTRAINKRRRNLEFMPLNSPFENCEAHHLSQKFVLYIPKEIHKSIHHNIWTEKNIALINGLAIIWAIENNNFENY